MLLQRLKLNDKWVSNWLFACSFRKIGRKYLYEYVTLNESEIFVNEKYIRYFSS
jgi:hypothetical protein